jgi:hypothetical protein
VFIDLPLPQLLWRVAWRSWRRWRSGELLWGTNRERFSSQLKVWDKHTSLLAWAIAEQRRKRRDFMAQRRDPRWRHVKFLWLRSSREVEVFARSAREHGSEAAR